MSKNQDEALLSATWINDRIDNVYTKCIAIMDDLVDEITSSGFLPWEIPLTPQIVNKMNPEQKQQLGLVNPERSLQRFPHQALRNPDITSAEEAGQGLA